MATEIVLPDDTLDQIKARASSIASTVAEAATRPLINLEETVRLHVVNALTEAVYNTVRLGADYIEGGNNSAAATLRSGEPLRNQKVLSISSSK